MNLKNKIEHVRRIYETDEAQRVIRDIEEDVKEAVLDYLEYNKIDGASDRKHAFETLTYLEKKYGEIPRSDEHAIKLIFGDFEK